ncbi:MAG: hypothetical protein AAGA77_15160 [Bacteroidota bacterium]
MIIRYLYILILIPFFQLGVAQDSFSKKELQQFVIIYMTSKDDSKGDTKSDQRIFVKYNIDQNRYQEITHSALLGKRVSLSPNEKKLIAEINQQNLLHGESKRKMLEKRCKNENFELSKYKIILEKYNTDIQFQRSLKPYFQSYFKTLK